jgi:hypothetical protein
MFRHVERSGFSHPGPGASLHVGGRIYHRCLAADVPTSPVHFWVHDRNPQHEGIDMEILNMLRAVLRTSCPFVRILRHLQLPHDNTGIPDPIPCRVVLGVSSSHDSVAVLADSSAPRHGVVIYRRQEEQPRGGEQLYVPLTSPLYEPLQYPLLYMENLDGAWMKLESVDADISMKTLKNVLKRVLCFAGLVCC